jgi:predicted NAD-dependent protein-ADP-ribosyltransferase YbiA (DUF1768 family)
MRRHSVMTETFDIRAKAPYPARELSNFAPHAFVFDGVACACMEGLLQSLKVADIDEQRRVCRLVGPHAQSFGRKHDWSITGTLWWNGKAAYGALFEQSEKFRDALAATGTAQLLHSLGKADPCETILTTEEFCTRLHRLRERLR